MQAALRNNDVAFGTGFMAKLTEREREILKAIQNARTTMIKDTQAIEGRGSAPSSLTDRLARLEERQRLQSLPEKPPQDVDPAYLRKEQFSNYILNDILLSQLEPKDKMTVYAAFESMVLRREFGENFGGLPYRHGSDSELDDMSRKILRQGYGMFSSADTLRLPYNLFASNRPTTQLYLLATYVPHKYFMRPEVKMAAFASLEDGEFYRIFEHIMCTIGKERIGDALVVMRHCASRLEHLCRVHRSRTQTTLLFGVDVQDKIKLEIAAALASRNEELRRRKSQALTEALLEASNVSASGKWGSYASWISSLLYGVMGLGMLYNYSGAPTVPGVPYTPTPPQLTAAAKIGADGDRKETGGLSDFFDYNKWKKFLGLEKWAGGEVVGALGLGTLGLGTLYTYFFKGGGKKTSDVVNVYKRLAESGVDLSMKMKNSEGDSENAMRGLNQYKQLLIIERKIELATYAISLLVHEAEDRLVKKNIYPRNMY